MAGDGVADDVYEDTEMVYEYSRNTVVVEEARRWWRMTVMEVEAERWSAEDC